MPKEEIGALRFLKVCQSIPGEPACKRVLAK